MSLPVPLSPSHFLFVPPQVSKSRCIFTQISFFKIFISSHSFIPPPPLHLQFLALCRHLSKHHMPYAIIDHYTGAAFSPNILHRKGGAINFVISARDTILNPTLDDLFGCNTMLP